MKKAALATIATSGALLAGPNVVQSIFAILLQNFLTSPSYTLAQLKPPQVNRICDGSFNNITSGFSSLNSSLGIGGCGLSISSGSAQCLQKYTNLICTQNGATPINNMEYLSDYSSLIGGDVYKKYSYQQSSVQDIARVDYYNSYLGKYWKECNLYSSDPNHCFQQRLSSLPVDMHSYEEKKEKEVAKIPSNYIGTSSGYKKSRIIEKNLIDQCGDQKSCAESKLVQLQEKEGELKKRIVEETEGRKAALQERASTTDDIVFTTEDLKAKLPANIRPRYVEKAVKKNREESLLLSFDRQQAKRLAILVDLDMYKRNFTAMPFFKKDFEDQIKNMDNELDTYIKN